jgi:Flp pilus assembly protein TadG
VLVLGIGLVVLTMLVIGGVVDASRLFLARRALASLADGAALRGAHDLDAAALYMAPASSDILPLSTSRVRADVVDYVAEQAAANGMAGVRVVTLRVTSGTVQVGLSRTESIPLLGTLLGSPGGEQVTAYAAARTSVR